MSRIREMSMESILDTPMYPNDANAETIRDYFKALLSLLLVKEEGFNSKRPFGSSGWKYDLYAALLKRQDLALSQEEHEDCERALLAAARYMCI